MPTDPVLFAYEAVVGTNALMSACLTFVFIRFVINELLYLRSKAFRSLAVRAAVAIMILEIGHLVNYGHNWINFVSIETFLRDINTTRLVVEPFTIGNSISFIGKCMMLWMFSPQHCRLRVLMLFVPAAIIIPIVVAILV